jgi:hypothetical protein
MEEVYDLGRNVTRRGERDRDDVDDEALGRSPAGNT